MNPTSIEKTLDSVGETDPGGHPEQTAHLAGRASRAMPAMIGRDSNNAHEMTCQPPRRRDKVAPGIAKPADEDRRDHEQIADQRSPPLPWRAKPATAAALDDGEDPERRVGTLATAHNAEDGRRQRQQPDEDNRVRGQMCWSASAGWSALPGTSTTTPMMVERQGQISRRSGWLTQCEQECGAQQGGNHRAGRCEKQRREVRNGNAWPAATC